MITNIKKNLLPQALNISTLLLMTLLLELSVQTADISGLARTTMVT